MLQPSLQPRCPHYELGWGLGTRLISMLFFYVVAPGKIANLRVELRLGLVVYLAWNKTRTTINGKPDTSDICYMIRYRELANSATRQIRPCTNQASLRLQANSRYAIDVRAYKKNIPLVVGPWSNKLPLQTNESGEYWASQGSVSRRSRYIFGSEIEYSNRDLIPRISVNTQPPRFREKPFNSWVGGSLAYLSYRRRANFSFIFLKNLVNHWNEKTNSGRRIALLAGSGRGFAWSVNLPVNRAWIGKTHEIQSWFGDYIFTVTCDPPKHRSQWIEISTDITEISVVMTRVQS